MDFIHNYCRFCKKVFCCAKCRELHENQEHECFICEYGYAVLDDPSEKLLNHIESKHWPLNCVYCKRVFKTILELKEVLSNKKCPVGCQVLAQLTPTPAVNIEKSKYPTPVDKKVTALSKLVTSTPMPNSQSNILQNMPQILTPVENEVKNTDENGTQKKLSENTSKRRVRFSRTPMTKEYTKFEKLSKVKINYDSPNTESGSSNLLQTPSTDFYTANDFTNKEAGTPNAEQSLKERVEEENYMDSEPAVAADAENPEKQEIVNADQPEENDVTLDNTLWESAINIEQNDDKIFSVTPVINKFTPISINLKKKKKHENIFPTFLKQSVYDISEVEHLTETPEPRIDSNENIFASTKIEPNVSCYSPPDNIENQAKDNTLASALNNSGSDMDIDVSKENIFEKPSKKSLWSSMSRIVKSVMGFSSSDLSETNMQNFSSKSLKRSHSENDSDGPKIKRYKLTDIKCRRSIRNLDDQISYEMRRTNSNVEQEQSSEICTVSYEKMYVDKYTQTDY